jgi:hypothetical protein
MSEKIADIPNTINRTRGLDILFDSMFQVKYKIVVIVIMEKTVLIIFFILLFQ